MIGAVASRTLSRTAWGDDCPWHREGCGRDRTRQDVLILAGTEDHFIPFHQTANLAKALVNARSVTTRISIGHRVALGSARWAI